MPDQRQRRIITDWGCIRLGIELEFISQITMPLHSPEGYPYAFITQELNKDSQGLRFKFNDGKGLELFNYERAWTLTPEETLNPDPTLSLPGSMFLRIPEREGGAKARMFLESSRLVRANPATGIMTGMELVSPITSFTQESLHKFTHKDIPYICDQLTPEKIPGCRFWVDPSCGMHVHISIIRDPENAIENFEFLTVQNLIAFWGVYEKEIERLHPGHRHPPNIYAASLRAIAPHDLQASDFGVAQWLFCVYSCRNFGDLRSLIDGSAGRGDPRDSKINIVAYAPRHNDTRRPDRAPTIEFREHAGTLDPTEVGNWIIFVTKAVRFSIYLAQRNYRFDIENPANCDIGDIFEALDFGYKTWRYYWEKVRGKLDDKTEAALRQRADEFDLQNAQDAGVVQEISRLYLALQSSAKEKAEEIGDWGPFCALAATVMAGLQLGDQDAETQRRQLIHLYYLSVGDGEPWDYVRKGLVMAWHSQRKGDPAALQKTSG